MLKSEKNRMKKLILIFLLLLPCYCFSQDIKTEKLGKHLQVVEDIMNGKFTVPKIDKNFIVIEKEWYSNPMTKGQWYGKVKARYLIKNGKAIPFTENMEDVYDILSDYNNPTIYSWEENYDIGIVYFQRTEETIHIMIRNDIWFSSFMADLEKDKEENYKIVNLPEYAYMHD